MEEHRRKPQGGHKLLGGSAEAWSTLVPALAPNSSTRKPRALPESPLLSPHRDPFPRTSLSTPPSRPTALPPHTKTFCTCIANATSCSSGGDSPCQLCDSGQVTGRDCHTQMSPAPPFCPGSLVPSAWLGTCREELATGRREHLAFRKVVPLLLGLCLPSLPPPREGKAAPT